MIGASKVARDITARKLAEEHTREAVAIARQAHLEADVANRAKTEFLAVMSHEIRTPLTSIAGFAHLLMNSRNLTRQQRRYIELIATANGALRTIVDDILDFSKVEAGRLELDRRGFSPTTLLHDTLEIVNVVAAAKSLRLKYTIDRGVPDWLHGDDARLRQILLNLLNNAIKFTAAGSIAVNVTKEPATDGRERIRFAVRDTGIGIADEQQSRLFAAFSQADSSISREYGGTGLGLAICKRLVELMDGEIGIVSVAGEGSTVWFTAHLPEAVYLEPKPEDSIELAEVMEAKARILVVDDLDTNREIVEAYLDERGYQVDTAGSAMDALQMLGSATYDLILMDIQMPVMDGVAATKRIRALPRPIRDVPIIAMTGNVLPEQVKSFLEAGMNDHVGKPIERAKLYNNVRRWLPGKTHIKARATTSVAAQFDETKFDEFVGVIGADRAMRIGSSFLKDLIAAFRTDCTLEQAQRDAHALINCAGMLGLDRFVAACRSVEYLRPGDRELQRRALEEVRDARNLARETLADQLLPSLRSMALQPTG